jgi:hypothetical protein
MMRLIWGRSQANFRKTEFAREIKRQHTAGTTQPAFPASKAEPVTDLPQDRERCVDVAIVAKVSVEQRGDHRSRGCIETPLDHAAERASDG